MQVPLPIGVLKKARLALRCPKPILALHGNRQLRTAPATGIICPYVLWQAYGDLGFIRPWWPQMKKFMELICTEENRHNGPDAESFGDWLHMNSETSTRLIGLAYRAYDACLMAEMAAAIGENADELRFQALAKEGRELFRTAFFEGDERGFQTQTA